MDTDDPVDFELQQEYQVASGIIANGTVLFRFQETTGPLVTCTYQGLSPTASPLSPTDLNLGRMLRFVGCTDGRPVNALRRGTHFELFVNPAPGYPVSVTPPIIRDGGCSEELPILTSDETRRLREGFDWSQMAKVEETNPGGSPALYYAWIYIRNPTEALALRKLYIHVLKRPLFTEELARYAGRCGTLTNPGDGEGVFVPVLIPGVTYNKLIDALTSPDVTGDRTIFDVVRIRALAPEHRYPNGAIRTDLLFASGFQYLDYETKPLRTPDQIQLDGGATKVLTDVLAWVANAARNVSEFLTNTLGAIAGAFAGRVEMTLHLHAINRDPSFVSPADPDPIMMRGWGDWAAARHPLGALGMEATILQRVGFLPFPFTSQGRTDRTGRVSIRAVRDARPFETALCMNLQTEAALVTDFLISNEVCDFRAFEVGREPTSYNLGLNFVLSDFSRDREGDIHVNNTRLTGLYQADDVWLWGNDVLHFRPSRRARILSGYFATTLSPTTQTGRKKLYAPCLGHPNNLSGAIAAVGAAGGALAAAGFGPGAAVGAAAGFVFGSVGVRDTRGIGRMVTLLFDAYDGHNERFGRVPGDGDVWTDPPAVLSPTGYANLDANLERVALHADTLKGFAQELAQGLGLFVFESGVLAGATIRDTMTYPALNHAMESQGYSWCDRCRVFALHSPLVPTAGVTPTIAQLFGACVADGLIASSLGGPPPEPALRIDANTCTPCPPSFTSDANGVCVPCVLPRVVVGNQCVECPADVVRDGNTLTDETLNAGFSIAGDACPGIFWLEIQNPLGVFTRGLPELTVLLDPVPGATQPQCERDFSLFVERYSSRVPYVREPTVTEFGRWAGGAFGSTCTPSRHEQGVSFPMRSFSVAELANEGTFAVRAGTPTDASSIMSIQVTPEGGPR